MLESGTAVGDARIVAAVMVAAGCWAAGMVGAYGLDFAWWLSGARGRTMVDQHWPTAQRAFLELYGLRVTRIADEEKARPRGPVHH